MKKVSVMMSVVLACTLLAGCSADTKQQSKQEPEQKAEQSMQVQEGETSDARENEYPRGEQIEDQTFAVNLEPIGNVTFSSYFPDASVNPLADVVFLIEQDGKILSQLPGVSEDNVNTEMFYQVEAVNFSDFNSDGYDDIILIISYYLGAGPQAATPHSTVRYYTGSDTGEFTYQKQMSEDATSALTEITIDSAKRFIGYEAFLNNEISVLNPYVEGRYLTVMDDENYDGEFFDAQKSYAFVDVNNDDKKELIFKISSYPNTLIYILGMSNDELICFDVKETHTPDIAFGVYDYGMVWERQNFEGFKMIVYSYTADGKPITARHFTEADEADMAAYEGEEPEWFDWSMVEAN